MTAAAHDAGRSGVDEAPAGILCVVCGGTEATWVHPVPPGLATLQDGAPMVWAFCDICELIYLNNQDEALVEVMKHSGAWDWETDDDVELLISEPLASLRRNDQGSRPVAR